MADIYPFTIHPGDRVVVKWFRVEGHTEASGGSVRGRYERQEGRVASVFVGDSNEVYVRLEGEGGSYPARLIVEHGVASRRAWVPEQSP